MIASLPEQLAQTWPLTLHLPFKVKCNARLKFKHKFKGHGCINCSGRLAIVWDHFGIRAGVIYEPYPVPGPLTLDLTMKVKCKVKGPGCKSCPGRLAIVWDHFGTYAGIISGRYPLPGPLNLNLTLKVKWKVKDHGRKSRSGRLAIVWDILVHVLA